MSAQQNIELMRDLKLSGMVKGYEDLLNNAGLQDLPISDQVAYILDAERRDRENRRLNRLLSRSRLKISASPEDIDYSASRGLDKSQVASLLTCEWINRGQNLIIEGPTGGGKTHLACALGNQAARKGLPVLYKRVTRLLEELEIAHHDGSLPRLRTQLAKMRLVILDDFALTPLTDRGRQDLLEIFDDRVGTGAVLITSQLPTSDWHDYIGEPTIADAVLDRIVHSAHRIKLRGESMRKKQAESAKAGRKAA